MTGHREDLGGAVLLVEDDPDIRETLVEVLEDAGFRAAGAANGREALDLLNGGRLQPSLIILDLMMPVMSGWQFREEQLHRPAIAGIPVVVISAYTDVEKKTEGMHVGATLRKPIDMNTIVRTVERYCQRSPPSAM